MKQPDIGKKIASLRKEKGLTQEDLVERCNINVRTIQRIESGDVMPRPITLRLILDALDYDIEMLHQELKGGDNEYQSMGVKRLQQLLLIGFNSSKNKVQSIKILQYAWIAGLIGFLIGFPEAIMEYDQFYNRFDPSNNLIYTVVEIITLVSTIVMLRGFVVIGDYYRNFLLKIASYLLIIHALFTETYDVLTVYFNQLSSQYADGGIAITLGAILIVYGVSLKKLKSHVGNAAGIAAVLLYIVGIFLITLVLWWLGLLFLVPVEILEIVILYKGYEMIRQDSEA